MAVGINIKRKNFKKFKKDFQEYAQSHGISDIIPVIKIDEETSLKEINLQTVKDLSLLEPYGEANKEPLFMIKNLKILAIRTLSEGKHLKLKLGQDSYIIDAIGFGIGELAENYLIGDKLDVIGRLEINKFNETEQVQLVIKDIRRSTVV